MIPQNQPLPQNYQSIDNRIKLLSECNRFPQHCLLL